MASPVFTVRHLKTRSELPETLTQGRAYFIDDEGSIVVNHGEGAVEYGAKKKADDNAAAIASLSAAKADKTGWDMIDPPYLNRFEERNHQYRGNNLGWPPTQKQLDTIKAGLFEDIYLGDYWTIPTDTLVGAMREMSESEMPYYVNPTISGQQRSRWRIMCFWPLGVIIMCASAPLFPIEYWGDNKNVGLQGTNLFQKGIPAATKLMNYLWGDGVLQNRYWAYSAAAKIGDTAGFANGNNYVQVPYLKQLGWYREYAHGVDFANIPLSGYSGSGWHLNTAHAFPYYDNVMTGYGLTANNNGEVDRPNGLENFKIYAHDGTYTGKTSGGIWLADPVKQGTHAVFLNSHNGGAYTLGVTTTYNIDSGHQVCFAPLIFLPVEPA